MSAQKSKCPVCRRTVFPTPAYNVWRHRDKAGHNCPMSGHPWFIVENAESEVA